MKLLMESWRNYVETNEDKELLKEGALGFFKGGALGSALGLPFGPSAALMGGGLGAAIGGLRGGDDEEEGKKETVKKVEPEEESDFMGVVLDIIGVIGDIPQIAGVTGGISVLISSSADAINGVRYIKRGEPFFALLSFISAIPAVGDVLGKGVKYFGKAATAATAAAVATGKTAKQAERVPKVAKAISRANTAKDIEMAFAKRFGPEGALQANKFFQFVTKNGHFIELLAKHALKAKEKGGGKLSKKDLKQIAKSDEFWQLLESIKEAGASGQA